MSTYYILCIIWLINVQLKFMHRATVKNVDTYFDQLQGRSQATPAYITKVTIANFKLGRMRYKCYYCTVHIDEI